MWTRATIKVAPTDGEYGLECYREEPGMPSIEIVEYDPAWPGLFDTEKARVLSVAGAYIDDIRHVGSTSVPGLGAKPTIDMLIELGELSQVEKCVQPLQALGYEYLGENGIPSRHFFRKPAGASWIGRLFNLHVVEKESAEWKRMLVFRDYLRLYSEDAHQYYLLKKELAEKYDADYEGYSNAKTLFIEGILVKSSLAE
jgi:GrpB-like predicted nucleotidyltransferase (UPF0157 family)